MGRTRFWRRSRRRRHRYRVPAYPVVKPPQHDPDGAAAVREDALETPERRPPALPERQDGIGIAQAMGLRPGLVAAAILACLLLALAYALVRTPSYTAEVRMRVANFDLGAPGALSGLSTAGQSLATTYALSVDADAVIEPAARRLRLPVGTVRQAVDATAVAQSPVLTVTARGDDEQRITSIANAVADGLQSFAASQGARQDPEELLRQYESQSQEVNRLQLAVNAAQPAGRPTAAQGRRLARARAALEAATLERAALQTAYRDARAAAGVRVEILRRASTARSDRTSRMQIALFAGLVGGGLLGAALATLLANRDLRRGRPL